VIFLQDPVQFRGAVDQSS